MVLGDAIVFSHDLVALRGRIAGWRAAAGKARLSRAAQETVIDLSDHFLKSVGLRVGVYTEARTSS